MFHVTDLAALNQMPPTWALLEPSEDQAFAKLQRRLTTMVERIFPNPLAPRTVVVLPSLSFDPDELTKITGVHHYEERMLCLLMLLQLPRTRVIYLSSQPIHETIIDYYLHLLPGIPGKHARQRLTMLSCHDSSNKPLTQKVLQRPMMLQRIRENIVGWDAAHITCFNATPLEKELALALDIPLYACDPALTHWGSKSSGRAVFRQAGVSLPDGVEHLRDEIDIIDALTALKRRQPVLRRAVIKLNEGFSGEGNAIFSFRDCPKNRGIRKWVADQLSTSLQFEAAGETWSQYRAKFGQMGGIVESWIDGQTKRSPSVQCRITPKGKLEIISTHDQVLGGPSGQIFLGCTFPADEAYRLEIQDAGQKIGEILRQEGVIGRFAVDFISVKEPDGWHHYAIEINLRKGGTTHPFLMLQFLTKGRYNLENGLYYTPANEPRYYYASDNIHDDGHIGLTPDDLIDMAVLDNLHFHGATQQGVVFHLMGALSEYGKFGAVCIGNTPQKAQALYKMTCSSLAMASACMV